MQKGTVRIEAINAIENNRSGVGQREGSTSIRHSGDE